MSFPEHTYSSVYEYSKAYCDQIAQAHENIDAGELEKAVSVLLSCYEAGHTLYVCGNGGSAAISNHLVCDHVKGIRNKSNLAPRVVSLVNNMETLTAIANDISYDDVFLYPLMSLGQPGDVLLTISSSGDSENVFKALKWAQNNGLKVISMTGFDGGRTAQMADVNLHVKANNYGIVEDVHQSLMHILAQFIRQRRMKPNDVEINKF